MKVEPLGKSQIEASIVGLGTYYFGGGDGSSAPVSYTHLTLPTNREV